MSIVPQEGKVVVKVSAEWCSPCKALAKIIEETELGITLLEVDLDTNSEFAENHRVRGVPTLILFKDGEEVSRKVGLITAAQLKDFIR